MKRLNKFNCIVNFFAVVFTCLICSQQVYAKDNCSSCPGKKSGIPGLSPLPVFELGRVPPIKPLSNKSFYDKGKPSPEKVKLGELLFFDKLLSGNKNTSCATCHHILTGTGDGLSLSVGEGAQGLGVTRDCGVDANAIHERVPRNAPPLFNLGAKLFTDMFHDGRVAVDPGQLSGFISPAGDQLPTGLDNVLAVQAMFPVTSVTEMAGQKGENPVANAAAVGDLKKVWSLLAKRLQRIPAYVRLFKNVYSIKAKKITFVHAANAIAAFESVAFRADNSPFDRYLRGDYQALSENQKQGMELFYGKAGCAVCHSGILQTDMKYHSIAMPQVGPGKGDGIDGHEDFGRERVTLKKEDRFKFRTPSLRNVVLTGPWGHDGAFNTLEGIVRHYLNPAQSLESYKCGFQLIMPDRTDLNRIDCIVHNSPKRRNAIKRSSEVTYLQLTDQEVDFLIEFLHALTDPSSLNMSKHIPKTVPSGLSLAE
ncbi:cytochrome-c peroxidase [Spartinivicinus poritis]|uniref:Cytochrome c domain-containing protein n=1 Tax=Spartinivicinus poritis TaxID=2994640 RepID=A0ABT5UI16_9GAMM|nr:cytochrome c peroxidase [Spartinivicinus sp. A2-2]MDE1466029.1 hypothetical protein [Spartinivicinus sp. A2-2]